MKLTPVLALAASALYTVTDAQLVCDVLPGMVSLDTQADECCGAGIILVSAGAIGGGMGGMLGGKCLHMGKYASYFPGGCTDCKGPNDSAITKCTAGSSPTLEMMMAARTIMCCSEYPDYGGLCQTAIIKGAKTGSGAMNSQVVGGFDSNGDGVMELCAEVTCPAAGTAAPTMAPTKAPTKEPKPPTDAPTKAPTPPTNKPTMAPTKAPTPPTNKPTKAPTKAPTMSPTEAPLEIVLTATVTFAEDLDDKAIETVTGAIEMSVAEDLGIPEGYVDAEMTKAKSRARRLLEVEYGVEITITIPAKDVADAGDKNKEVLKLSNPANSDAMAANFASSLSSIPELTEANGGVEVEMMIDIEVSNVPDSLQEAIKEIPTLPPPSDPSSAETTMASAAAVVCASFALTFNV